MLVSTTGITIHTHYCKTENNKQQSLFFWDIHCHHDAANNDCCTNNSEKCSLETAKSNCCSNSEQIFIIELNYDVPGSNTELEPMVIIVPDNESLQSTASIISDNKSKPQYTFCASPPLTGKQKVINYRKSKTDPLPEFDA